MKERPILFSAPMVRAILAGTKTQTRLVAPIEKLDIQQHDGGLISWHVGFSKPLKGSLGSYSGGPFSEAQARGIIASMFCPYGQPGDRMWVREKWAPIDAAGTPIIYGADADEDGSVPYLVHGSPIGGGVGSVRPDRWRPSIHMPRWASRITLEIVSVRVERLQEISESDASSEGAPKHFKSSRDNFCALWQQINGAGSWNANPLVWVVEFKRVAP